MYTRIRGYIKGIDVYMYILSFLIIYLSGSVTSAINSKGMLYKIMMASMLVLSGILAVRKIRTGKVSRNFWIICIGFPLYLVLNGILYSGSFIPLFNRMIMFSLFFLMIEYTRIREISLHTYLYRILLWHFTISLIIWILINIFHVALPWTPIKEYIPGAIATYRYENYMQIYISNVSDFFSVGSLTMRRMMGFFWEPGVYGVYLCYALYRWLFFEKKNKYILFLIVINLLVTMSTTALMLATFLVLMKVVCSKKIKEKYRFVLYILAFFVVAIVVIKLLLIKSSSVGGGAVSYDTRVSDIVVGLRLFMNKPLLGYGFVNMEPFVTMQDLGRGCSNGIITILFTTGILGFGIVVFPFIKNYCNMTRQEKNRQFIYCITLLIMNMTEPVYTLPFMIFLFVEQYVNLRNKCRSNK